MNKAINKIVRAVGNLVSGNELAQSQSGAILGGESNKEFAQVARQAGADGCVLLKNNNNILPFCKDDNIAVFGRVQYDYFYVGNGSGGDVCTPYTVSLIDGLRDSDNISLNEDVLDKYISWCTNKKNIPDPGFWGNWPRYYEEMPLKSDFVLNASKTSNKALVVIGRSAGEDRENALSKGSFYLTKKEKKMLDAVTENFNDVAVILNIGSIMDFAEFEEYGDKIGALMIVWQSGMESGNAVADVLSGKVNPSGRLSDTIAKTYSDYPSQNFGNKEYNNYEEDIFVGYRYFETFAPDKVLYEFGFGLSYTEFEIKCKKAEFDGKKVKITANVKNIGNKVGKEVVELYAKCPQGKLGKAAKVLIAFGKTDIIAPNEEQDIQLMADKYLFSSFDDSGVTGNQYSYVLESGKYEFYLGKSVKNCDKVLNFTLDKIEVLETLQEILPIKPENSFKRFTAVGIGDYTELQKKDVPTSNFCIKNRILNNLPNGNEITGDKGYKLADVKSGKVAMDDFVAQLSLDELELISRGEGMMNSTLGAKGNAGALGGVSKSLRSKGIPAMITTDGPSGIRLQSSCSLLPSGTALACTFDTSLVNKLYTLMGKEMIEKGSDILLAPGMNIHRNPLCGRNFEYYSEDPILSGYMATATVKGIQKNGVSACPKHFACNNQEYNRNYNNSFVSQRALREIYLKGFELCVKNAKPLNIMTSYNKINGVWSHYNYDLCTTVLRGEWGYDSNVMTDWWMRYAPSPEFPLLKSNAYRVRAQVDVLMPGAKTAISKSAEPDGTLIETYTQKDGITLGEMQRTAKNVLNYIIKTDKELH